jgi:hypothetical protein
MFWRLVILLLLAELGWPLASVCKNFLILTDWRWPLSKQGAACTHLTIKR